MGACAALLIVATLAAVLPYVSARAQGGVPCTAIENDAERLACYDRALRAPAPPAPPAAQAPAQTAAPASAVAAPAATAPAAAVPAAAVPAATAPAIAAPATPVPVAPAPTNTPAATTTAAPAPREEEQRVVSVTIVSVSLLQGRPATFTGSDGTTWVQTDSQRVMSLPDTPFTAEVKSGAMSSTFLVPQGRGRAIRVRTVAR